MITQQGWLRERKHRLSETEEAGFTLIELLVVIAILGILAAIVVFSVGGISDKGQYASCKTDMSTVQTAEEAAFASNATSGVYLDMDGLRTGGFLSTDSNWHDVVLATDKLSYYISEKDDTCGVTGDYVAGNKTLADPKTGLGCLTAASKPGAGGWGDC